MRSAAWLFGCQIGGSPIRLAALAILARRLSPDDFGVVALASVVLQFITLVADAGVATYVIYDRGEGWRERVHAAFWLNLAITGVQVALALALLPLVDRMFEQTRLVPIALALIAAFVVTQLAAVPNALVQRELEHRLLARRDIALDLGSAMISVALALGGAGVWSLVLPALAVEPVRLIVALALSRWRPRLPLRTSEWRRILRYTTPLMGTRVIGLVANEGDTLAVGKLLGSQPLGFYNMAWQLSNLVGRNITGVVTSITMPALAMFADDEPRLTAAFLRTIRLLSIVSFPILVGMFAVADDLVLALYGEGWEPVATLLRIFIVFTIVRSVTSPASILYNVVGRPDIGLKFSIGFLPAYLLAIGVGVRWGVVGVAWGVALVRFAGSFIDLGLATRQVHLAASRAIGAMLPATAIAIPMGVATWAAAMALEAAGAPLLVRLPASVALGIVLYLGGVHVFRPQGYDDLLAFVRSVRPRTRSFTRAGRE